MSRVDLILNPAAGGGHGLQLEAEVTAALEGAGHTVIVHRTERPGHAVEIVHGLNLEPAVSAGDSLGNVVCGLGGDGTFHEIVAGMMAREEALRTPVAILPGGSGNSLVHDLGTTRLADALEHLLAGRQQGLDLIELEVEDPDGAVRSMHAFNIVGFGLAAASAARSERMRWLGNRRYTPATCLEVMLGRPGHIEVELDGEPVAQDLAMLLVCNTQHTGRAMRAAPGAILDDGLADAILVRRSPALALLPLLAKVGSGGHLGSARVDHRHVREFRVTTHEPGLIVVDGEILPARTVTARLLPQALELRG